jgi:PTH1 family peptidyl-tRNA hydrolase
MSYKYLIVGLGNPGAEYAKTRHNIGWMVADAFVEKQQSSFKDGKGDWYEAEVQYRRQSILVVKPTTYMNLSGEAVKVLMRKHQIASDRIIAIVDEYNFPVGKIHLKTVKSDGGHNGIASLIQHIPKADFSLLRCGIAKNFGPGELVRYVLAPFAEAEQAHVQSMIEMGVKALETVAAHGILKSMNIINSWKSSTEIITT